MERDRVGICQVLMLVAALANLREPQCLNSKAYFSYHVKEKNLLVFYLND